LRAAYEAAGVETLAEGSTSLSVGHGCTVGREGARACRV